MMYMYTGPRNLSFVVTCYKDSAYIEQNMNLYNIITVYVYQNLRV